MNAAELAEHVRRLVDQAPPMSARQRSDIAALLRPGLAEAGLEHEPAGQAPAARRLVIEGRTRAA